jgi:hypothetical protein
MATITAVFSVALLAIAFSTDNWSRITVDRKKIEDAAADVSSISLKTNEGGQGVVHQHFGEKEKPQLTSRHHFLQGQESIRRLFLLGVHFRSSFFPFAIYRPLFRQIPGDKSSTTPQRSVCREVDTGLVVLIKVGRD